MLTLIFGMPCAGKTALIRELEKLYQWKIIRCYTTRALRDDDLGRICVSHEEYVDLDAGGNFLFDNRHYASWYGTSLKDVELSQKNKQNYILDWRIENLQQFSTYDYLGVLLLPESEEQLRNQIEFSGRIHRLEEALSQWKDLLSQHKRNCIEDLGIHIVVNHPNRLGEAVDQVRSLREIHGNLD